MKKKVLCCSLIALAIAPAIYAQGISNAGMEQWEDVTIGMPPVTLHHPTDWHGSDEIIAQYGALVGITPAAQVVQSEDAHSGSYAAAITTIQGTDSLGNVPGALANANLSIDLSVVMQGDVDMSNIQNMLLYSNGTPIPEGKKVDTVKAWVKLTPDNQNQAAVVVMARKDTTVIGEGSATIVQGADYQEISVPLTYSNGVTDADTLIVLFSSSNVMADSPVVGNTLLVDDVSMVLSDDNGTGIVLPVLSENAMMVYPNPSHDGKIYFNLNTSLKPSEFSLAITDVAGKVLYSQVLQQNINQLDCSRYAAGNYFYTLIHTPTKQKETGKFVISNR